MLYNPMLWAYDRKRSHNAMEAYGMMDSSMCHAAAAGYYTHLQPPLKYPKVDPTVAAYYQYADDPERYQANITVSVQSQPPATFGSASGTTALGSVYSQYTGYLSTPHTAFGSMGTSDSSTVHTFNAQHMPSSVAPVPHVATASGVNAMSPVRSATVDEGASMTNPLTPPLSVSPVPALINATSPQSIASTHAVANSYMERENTIGYRSESASPCVSGDCDSTTNTDNILDHKLPLHVLSDLSEGLPLPGM